MREASLVSHARVTYRYLRLAIVVITVALLVSIAFEALGDGCFVGSISGYFFTPVRTAFVGGLVAIGVCLIATGTCAGQRGRRAPSCCWRSPCWSAD